MRLKAILNIYRDKKAVDNFNQSLGRFLSKSYDDGYNKGVMDMNKENLKLRGALAILQRYHGGDGTVTREDVAKALTTGLE